MLGIVAAEIFALSLSGAQARAHRSRSLDFSCPSRPFLGELWPNVESLEVVWSENCGENFRFHAAFRTRQMPNAKFKRHNLFGKADYKIIAMIRARP